MTQVDGIHSFLNQIYENWWSLERLLKCHIWQEIDVEDGK